MLQQTRVEAVKGYYDRFLAQNPCFKVAICYDFQLVSALPAHEKDVAMNAVVTPTRVYR
jgi:5-formyltetrahydrofolate cyclo-ligase